jgi:hypothetical protein
MVNRFEIGLTTRQGNIVEDALRRHLSYLNECEAVAKAQGDSVRCVELSSTANVVRNTLAQVKDGIYNLSKWED